MTSSGVDSPKGVLLVDKSVGPTSHDAVREARRALGQRRIGHTGTLDPFATGLLILLVGPATRLANTFDSLEKRYTTTVRLGVETDTLDKTGEVVRTRDGASQVTRDAVERALARQVGTIAQVPPRFSAKKIDGEAAHRRVRRGEDVELKAASVTVHSIEVLQFEPPLIDLEVCCSTGTYIRSIARDLGDALDLGGHLTELRRTAIGSYAVDDAVGWDGFARPDAVRAALIPTAQALEHLQTFALTDEERDFVLTGRAVPTQGLPPEVPFPVLATHGAAVLSVGEVRNGCFHPKKVFPDGA